MRTLHREMHDDDNPELTTIFQKQLLKPMTATEMRKKQHAMHMRWNTYGAHRNSVQSVMHDIIRDWVCRTQTAAHDADTIKQLESALYNKAKLIYWFHKRTLDPHTRCGREIESTLADLVQVGSAYLKTLPEPPPSPISHIEHSESDKFMSICK
jgi:chlorite dismutase